MTNNWGWSEGQQEASRQRAAARPGEVPHYPLTERLLLAAIFCDEAVAFEEIDSTDLVTSDFFTPEYGITYDAMCSLRARGEPVTVPTVAREFERNRTIGEMDSLTQGTTENFLVYTAYVLPVYSALGVSKAWADIVHDGAVRRATIQRASEEIQNAYQPPRQAQRQRRPEPQQPRGGIKW